MRITGSQSIIGAVEFGTSAVVFALGRAMQDGIDRAAALQEADRAHAVGQAYFVRRLRQRKAEAAQAADEAAARLMANRKCIHG